MIISLEETFLEKYEPLETQQRDKMIKTVSMEPFCIDTANLEGGVDKLPLSLNVTKATERIDNMKRKAAPLPELDAVNS